MSYVSKFIASVKSRVIHFLLTSVFCLTPVFFLVSTSHATLVNIPDVIKAEVPVPEVDVKSWILADFETGWILGSKDADLRIEPASLTKLMTSYLVFDAISKGEISMQDTVYVSKKAWKTPGSKMFIQVDTYVTIEELLQGLIIQSGNDAAVALAEHIGGTEEGFAARMNLTSAKLGMVNSSFANSSGLPADDHYSTARDMTLLSISLIRKFPELFKYYSQLEYTYNDITQQNRNVLLTRDPTVDGLKTGYTKNAGYCLIGTANREGTRLVATVTGSNSKSARANEVQSLLQFGYGAYDGLIVYSPGDQVKALPLWMGTQPEVAVSVSKNLGIVYPKGKKDLLSAALELPDSLEAPLESGTEVGHIQVKFDGNPVLRSPLLIEGRYDEGPWYSQLLDSIKQMIF
jgi:D-alanyl-D-alanine carboxypeptidase (penicillin-binding protein 5/6)